jgi:hypothetical protein
VNVTRNANYSLILHTVSTYSTPLGSRHNNILFSTSEIHTFSVFHDHIFQSSLISRLKMGEKNINLALLKDHYTGQPKFKSK